MEVLPAPDGAETTMNNPLAFPVFSLLNVLYLLSQLCQIALDLDDIP